MATLQSNSRCYPNCDHPQAQHRRCCSSKHRHAQRRMRKKTGELLTIATGCVSASRFLEVIGGSLRNISYCATIVCQPKPSRVVPARPAPVTSLESHRQNRLAARGGVERVVSDGRPAKKRTGLDGIQANRFPVTKSKKTNLDGSMQKTPVPPSRPLSQPEAHFAQSRWPAVRK